jgi:uncharacterized protein (PEP-CTERM system associated)
MSASRMHDLPRPPRVAARLAGAAALALLPAIAARAQNATGGVLPLGLPPAAVILNTPNGGLAGPQPGTLFGLTPDARYQPAVPAAAGPRNPAWSFTPSIGLEELFNDNIFQTQTNRRADFITAVTPALEVHGDTPRVNLNLRYAPTLEVYARTRSADAIAQQLLGTGTATLIPDTLFVNARALASVQPSGGGLGGLVGSSASLGSPLSGGFGGTTAPGALVLGKENRAQTIGFSVTPYLMHRFGDFGTGKLGVTLSYSDVSSGTEATPIPGTATGLSQRQQTGEATAQFQSGAAFGRVRDFVLLDAAQSTGTGVMRGARSDVATNWIGYALNRMVMPFAEFGAESIYYNTAVPTHIDDAVWEAGVVLMPNPDSQLSIGYGHHQGADSIDVRGYYALSARTRLTASYTTGLATDVQQIQSQLGLASFDPLGNAVNVETGAPLFLGNGLLGTQTALYRSHTLSLTGTTLLDRDSLTVSVQRQQQTPVGNASAGTGGGVVQGIAQDGTTLTGSWTHLISERTSLGTSASYTLSTFHTTTTGTERFLAATAGVSYRLSETVSTIARYSFFDRNSNFAGRSFTDNVVLVGVTKRF